MPTQNASAADILVALFWSALKGAGVLALVVLSGMLTALIGDVRLWLPVMMGVGLVGGLVWWFGRAVSIALTTRD